MTTTIDTHADPATDAPVAIDETASAPGGGLFDSQPYVIPVPTLDGNRADTLKLAFAGAIEIDPTDNQALEFFKGLRFGQDIDLRITATVAKNGWTLRRDDENGDTVTHQVGLKVHSYEIDGE